MVNVVFCMPTSSTTIREGPTATSAHLCLVSPPCLWTVVEPHYIPQTFKLASRIQSLLSFLLRWPSHLFLRKIRPNPRDWFGIGATLSLLSFFVCVFQLSFSSRPLFSPPSVQILKAPCISPLMFTSPMI